MLLAVAGLAATLEVFWLLKLALAGAGFFLLATALEFWNARRREREANEAQ